VVILVHTENRARSVKEENTSHHQDPVNVYYVEKGSMQ